MIPPEVMREMYWDAWFPMDEDGNLGFFRSSLRALLPIEGIHVSRSLARTLRSGKYHYTFNRCLERVVRECAKRPDKWLSEEIILSVIQAEKDGWAFSCEAWLGEELAGGVYGLLVGGSFTAESMFTIHTDAGKCALKTLVDRCRECGCEIFDCQFINPHTESLGAYEMSDEDFMNLFCQVRVKSLHTAIVPADQESCQNQPH